jgi:hypothetical protein
MSPTRTSRAALATCPLERILPNSQARLAKVRVLKNRAVHSHKSIRTPVIGLFSYNGNPLRRPERFFLDFTSRWPNPVIKAAALDNQMR